VTVVYVLGGWILVSLLAYLLVLPFLTISARSDRLGGRVGRDAMADPPSRVPSPQKLGYSGLVLERLAEHARTILGFDQAWILASERSPSASLAAVAGAGTDPDFIGRRVPRTEGTQALNGAACATIHVGAEARGRLCVGSPMERRELMPRESQLLEELAELVGELLRHHEHGQLMLGDSEPEIRALVKALAEADGATYRHSLEVAATAREVARTLGLSEADLIEIQLAALMHDVGKLRVPESVLRKPGRLTSQEQQLLRLHPEWGAEMVARVPGLEAVALIVRLHHERPDGRGYPHGLIEDQIPMGSRIVSVCSAYGVMTKRWAHRDPVDVDAALNELRRYSGTQFDPYVVEALAHCLRASVPVAA
jgi:putative nucleotidyltransferase with HDIG domain